MLSAARADGPRDEAADKRRLLAALAALDDAPTMGRARDLDAPRSSRWTFGALAGAGVAVIAAIAASMSSSSPIDTAASSASAAPPAPTSAPTSDDAREPTATAIPSIDVANLPAVRASASSGGARRTDVASKSKDAPASAAAADELAAVERVRTQLAGGDVKGARREIAAYRAAFARGRFVEEIAALEVEALAADGARADAKAKAAEFAARYPSSPYARRVRSVVSTLDEAVTP